MLRFKYKARDQSGILLKGMIYGKNRNDVFQQLRKKELYPIKLKASLWDQIRLLPTSKSITYLEMTIFCQEFSTLLQAGLAIPQALKLLKNRSRKPLLQEVTLVLLKMLEEGKTLYQGFNDYAVHLPPFFCQLIRVGEMTHSLERILVQLATYYEQEDRFKKEMYQSLAYPVILLFASLGVILFLVIKILPGFQEIFQSFTAELPILTNCLMAISQHVSHNIKNYMVGLLISVLFLSKIFKLFKKRLEPLVYCLPFYGTLKRDIFSARFARTLGLLLGTGLEIVPAMQLMLGTSGHVIDQYLENILKQLQQGKDLVSAFSCCPFFATTFIEMVGIGQESNALGQMCQRSAIILEADVQKELKRFLILFEPILLIGIALLVGIIVFAVMQPLFEMTKLF